MRTSKKEQRSDPNRRSVFARRRADLCPVGYCTSGTLRTRLNITVQQFRSLAAAGVITANKFNEARFALYSEEQVQALLNRQEDGSLFKHLEDPLSYTAADGVAVFGLLEKQTPLHRIVIETNLLPQVVRRIQQEYNDMNGLVTIPKAILDQMNLLRARLTGPFPLRSATDILTVMAMAAEDRTCSQCNAVSCAELCMSCMRSRLTPPQPQQPQPQLEGHGANTLNGTNGNGAHAHHAPPPTLPTGDRSP